MAKDPRFEALMALMALKAMSEGVEEKAVSPFSISVEVSPVSVSCHTQGHKKLIEDMDAMEWFNETRKLVEPIMKEQTAKFAEIIKNKFGLEYEEPKEGSAADFFSKFFGGGY